MRIPPILRRNDTIGLAAPAGPIREDVFREGREMLRRAGLEPVFSPEVLSSQGYLAGGDRRRAEELHRLWEDQDVKAILAVRGGYGSGRLLPRLDFSLFARRPKILMGFSDLTFLLNAVTVASGLVTFHGPMLSTMVRDGSAALEGLNRLRFPRMEDIRPRGLEVLRPAAASGRLFGGNLACLCHLLGTGFEPPWDNAILLIEDINEPMYRIDRMLTHLATRGVFDAVAGVVIGHFLDNGPRESRYIDEIWERVLELTPDATAVWGNFPAGHGPDNVVLPIGARVVMDSGAGALRFPEPVLSWE